MLEVKFRKKPVVIDAIQYTRENCGDVCRFAGMSHEPDNDERCAMIPFLEIGTTEGVMRASVGDWIIRGVAGEVYPCKPDIFEATYEAVTEDYPDALTEQLDRENVKPGPVAVEWLEQEARAEKAEAALAEIRTVIEAIHIRYDHYGAHTNKFPIVKCKKCWEDWPCATLRILRIFEQPDIKAGERDV